MLVISADLKKKKAACHVSYNASPEKKGQPPVPVIGLTLRKRGKLPG